MKHRRFRRRLGAVAAATALLMGAGTAAEAASTTLSDAAKAAPLVSDPADYVDPFIGTGLSGSSFGEINNFPGPAAPFGMMQFSPDTQNSYAGYQYHNDRIRGFSLDHASVGCSAFGDVPILPVVGDIGSAPWDRTEKYSHDSEQAEPGSYAVTLADSGVRAELTATTRTGLAAFTFPATDAAQVLVKGGASLGGNDAADMKIVADNQVTGSATTGHFCGKSNTYTVHYAITFDRPFTAHGTWDGSKVQPGGDAVDAKRAGTYLTFDTSGEKDRTVRAKVSMSYVSVAGAQANMAAEIPGWDLGAVAKSTRDQWTRTLRKVRVAGRDEGELKTFYTSLYHSLMHPNTFNDVDGRYIGFDDKIRTLPKGRTQYANFSDWDTYRSLAPLQAMLFPKEASDMAQSLVNDAQQNGWWPRWPMANQSTSQMTGDNSVPLVAALYAYGARDFDVKTALKYLVKGATSVDDTPGAYKERPGVESYVERGYLPNNDSARGDHQLVGASITLEWSIDDFAIAQLAKATGDKRTAATFTKRSQNWQNLFNPTTGYVQPRSEDGLFPDGPAFQAPSSGEIGQSGFDEGNAAQYNWLVPQNMAGLTTAMGGSDVASKRLDTFLTQLNAGPNAPYMWAGNEPDFAVPWAYNYLGEPWKTQETVRKVATTMFGPTPDGEPGNDDLGAQSAWYVWAALGVYPATPGTADLTAHSPLFERAVLDLPGSHTLDLRAPGASADTKYVHGLKLDGAKWERTYLPQSAVRKGGRLDFTLSATPDKTWATGAKAAPPSYQEGEHAFLANVSPSQATVDRGKSATLTVDAQRLGGKDRTLKVTAQAPDGLTLDAGRKTLTIDKRSGSGSVEFTATAGSGTADGFYRVPVTVQGRTGPAVKQTVYVQVAAEGSFGAAYNATGISSDTDTAQGDFDRSGGSYSRQALAAAGLTPGAKVEASGTAFTWPASPAGRPDHLYAAGQTIDLTTQSDDVRKLTFVGAAIYGDVRTTATVTFDDGSTAKTDLSFGDWVLPGGSGTPVFDNSVVAKTEYRNPGHGGPAYIYATKPFEAPDGRTVKSVTLPENVNMHLFGIGVG
ncbi:GH92 family glycosyl hydrolase [Streptomyces sp. NPDC058371]|uniref:GH92 family glycosyl hydrolase n=1 Tax=Streptomyces sp. NPDC058371 TaxID=3346463 RepID=UPI0036522A36